MMTDPPRQVFSLISNALIAVFVLSLIFSERLPEEIFGIRIIIWQVFLLIGAYLVRMGWRVVVWFRRRS